MNDEDYESWKKTIVRDKNILGGNPVFPKSRLSVLHVAAMMNQGVSISEILEDYPYLTEQDLYFSDRFASEFFAI